VKPKLSAENPQYAFDEEGGQIRQIRVIQNNSESDRLRDRERTTNGERELVNFRASRVGNAQSKQGDQP
ncbi:hypothetical protein LINGRAHAP2_LOCUS29335, partial [Linum grandiflorum]